jgi:hypothetical protein
MAIQDMWTQKNELLIIDKKKIQMKKDSGIFFHIILL